VSARFRLSHSGPEVSEIDDGRKASVGPQEDVRRVKVSMGGLLLMENQPAAASRRGKRTANSLPSLAPDKRVGIPGRTHVPYDANATALFE
jgi:hypothetical protein